MTNLIIGGLALYALFGYWLDRRVTASLGHDHEKKLLKPIRAMMMPVLVPYMTIGQIIKRRMLQKWLLILFGNLALLYPRKRITFATRSVISRIRLMINAYLRLPKRLGERADVYLTVRISRLERRAANAYTLDELAEYQEMGGLVH